MAKREFKEVNEMLYRVPRPKRLKASEVPQCTCSISAGSDLGCDDERCLNRSCFIECSPRFCVLGKNCANQRIRRKEFCKVSVFDAGGKGKGLRTEEDVDKDTLITEYLGEVIGEDELVKRLRANDRARKVVRYFMELYKGAYLDAQFFGSLARYLNHSCEPNSRVEKWHVGNEVRVAIVADRKIHAHEEITIDYKWEYTMGQRRTKCLCGAKTCRQWLEKGAEQMQIMSGDWRKPNEHERVIERADHLVGRRVRIFWDGNDGYFTGTVELFDPKSGKHKVLYDDETVSEELLCDLTLAQVKSDAAEAGNDTVPDSAARDDTTKTNVASAEDEKTSISSAEEGKGAARRYESVKVPTEMQVDTTSSIATSTSAAGASPTFDERERAIEEMEKALATRTPDVLWFIWDVNAREMELKRRERKSKSDPSQTDKAEMERAQLVLSTGNEADGNEKGTGTAADSKKSFSFPQGHFRAPLQPAEVNAVVELWSVRVLLSDSSRPLASNEPGDTAGAISFGVSRGPDDVTALGRLLRCSVEESKQNSKLRISFSGLPKTAIDRDYTDELLSLDNAYAGQVRRRGGTMCTIQCELGSLKSCTLARDNVLRFSRGVLGQAKDVHMRLEQRYLQSDPRAPLGWNWNAFQVQRYLSPLSCYKSGSSFDPGSEPLSGSDMKLMKAKISRLCTVAKISDRDGIHALVLLLRYVQMLRPSSENISADTLSQCCFSLMCRYGDSLFGPPSQEDGSHDPSLFCYRAEYEDENISRHAPTEHARIWISRLEDYEDKVFSHLRFDASFVNPYHVLRMLTREVKNTMTNALGTLPPQTAQTLETLEAKSEEILDKVFCIDEERVPKVPHVGILLEHPSALVAVAALCLGLVAAEGQMTGPTGTCVGIALRVVFTQALLEYSSGFPQLPRGFPKTFVCVVTKVHSAAGSGHSPGGPQQVLEWLRRNNLIDNTRERQDETWLANGPDEHFANRILNLGVGAHPGCNTESARYAPGPPFVCLSAIIEERHIHGGLQPLSEPISMSDLLPSTRPCPLIVSHVWNWARLSRDSSSDLGRQFAFNAVLLKTVQCVVTDSDGNRSERFDPRNASMLLFERDGGASFSAEIMPKLALHQALCNAQGIHIGRGIETSLASMCFLSPVGIAKYEQRSSNTKTDIEESPATTFARGELDFLTALPGKSPSVPGADDRAKVDLSTPFDKFPLELVGESAREASSNDVIDEGSFRLSLTCVAYEPTMCDFRFLETSARRKWSCCLGGGDSHLSAPLVIYSVALAMRNLEKLRETMNSSSWAFKDAKADGEMHLDDFPGFDPLSVVFSALGGCKLIAEPKRLRPFLAQLGNSKRVLGKAEVTRLAYVAPELLLCDRQAKELLPGGPDSSAADIWSLGCLTSTLLLGKPLVAANTVAKQLSYVFRVCGSPAPGSGTKSRKHEKRSERRKHKSRSSDHRRHSSSSSKKRSRDRSDDRKHRKKHKHMKKSHKDRERLAAIEENNGTSLDGTEKSEATIPEAEKPTPSDAVDDTCASSLRDRGLICEDSYPAVRDFVPKERYRNRIRKTAVELAASKQIEPPSEEALELLERCLALHPRDRPTIDEVFSMPMLSSIAARLENPTKCGQLHEEWKRIVTCLSRAASDRVCRMDLSERQVEGFFCDEVVQDAGDVGTLQFVPEWGQLPKSLPIFQLANQPAGGPRPPVANYFGPRRTGPSHSYGPRT